MSATLAPPTRQVPAAAPRTPEFRGEVGTSSAAVAADPAAAEVHRWLIGLGTPFVLGAVLFALAVGTPASWLIGPALVLGPMLFMLMTIYLCISSDSNAAVPEHC
jgi:hypothetical protein